MNKKESIINKFFKTFCYDGYKGFWGDFLNGWVENYKPKTDKVIICNPLRNIGIVDVDMIEKENNIETEWVDFSLSKQIKINKKDSMYITKSGYVYPLIFINDIISKFLKGDEVFQVKIVGRKEDNIALLCFMIDGEWAISLTNKYEGEFEITEEGVWFIESDYDGELSEVDRQFVEWINGTASLKIQWYSIPWKKSIYKFDYYFEEIKDDLGDMMLI